MNNQEVLQQLLNGNHLEPDELKMAKKLVKDLQTQLEQKEEYKQFKASVAFTEIKTIVIQAKNEDHANRIIRKQLEQGNTINFMDGESKYDFKERIKEIREW